MNNLLSQKWCLCLNVQNRIKLCRTKNHKFSDDTTVDALHKWCIDNKMKLNREKCKALMATAADTTWLEELQSYAISIRQSCILLFFPIENFQSERPILTNIFHSD